MLMESVTSELLLPIGPSLETDILRKNHKKGNVNHTNIDDVSVVNIAFFTIFAVFNPSPLTVYKLQFFTFILIKLTGNIY